MPPFGLYPMPRSHLYGGRMKPKIYNTNDFQSDAGNAAPGTDVPEETRDAGLSKSAVAEIEENKKSAKKGKGENKEKKRRLSLGGDKNAKLERLLSEAEATPDKEGLPKKKKKKKKDRKKNHRSKRDTQDVVDASDQEGGRKGAGRESRSEKKRKRESGTHGEATNVRSANEEYLAGQQLARSSILGSSLPKRSRQEAQMIERPSVKRTKRKSQGSQPEANAKTEPGTVTEARKQDKKCQIQVPIPASPHGAAEQTVVTVPVPSDWTNGSDELRVKEQKKVQSFQRPTGNPVTPNQTPAQIPTKTSIPFPQLSREHKTNSVETKARKVDQDVHRSPNVLVPETPPSRVSKKTPVPLPPSAVAKNGAVSIESKPRINLRNASLGSSPTRHRKASIPSITHASPESSKAALMLPSVPNALTDANLKRFKKPLTDGSQEQARTKTDPSTISSLRTSSASMSIVEAFARAGKVTVRSVADKNPFLVTHGDDRGPFQSPELISLDVFSDRYRQVTNVMNFDEENRYLEEHLDWDAQYTQEPAPCLHKMTGCSAKKEELLSLSKEQDMEILAQLDTPRDDVAKLFEASNQAQRAEDLLMLATRARVPVPIGYIEGRWTLFCPKYADTHFDRYGYGQRSLIISPIAGFKNKGTFTARMQLPPRSMAFSILAFHIPPHASFRTTSIKTASEGYTMDVIFLGNGYLHIRADLGKLLTGTIRKPNEVSHIMEFIGVHERATQWWPARQGVEDGGQAGGK